MERSNLKEMHKKLREYRYCTDMSDMQYGYYIRWIPLKDRVWKSIDDTATVYQSEKKVQLSGVDVVNFKKLDNEKKLQGIEMVLDRSIRTNLAKDGGGVELKGIEGNEVSIHYQGACGSCPTSTSGTLKYIQGQLREQLHPELTVKPV